MAEKIQIKLIRSPMSHKDLKIIANPLYFTLEVLA
jgi:hypothetical protein